MASTVFATVSTPGPPGPAGATGPAGYSPLYIVAAGVPTGAVGNNGDMYINSTTSDVYGPKTAGAWGAIVCNIKGAAGAAGPAGYSPQYIVAAGPPSGGVGNNGDMYINSSTSDVYGPKTAGAWGAIACNIRGTAGAQGPPGVAYTPKGAWSSATTYAQGDEATDGAILYISLQSGNLNKIPASNPTWWQPVATGGGLADPTTTLGDLIVRGASAPPTRLPVGANGLVLTADSAAPVGVKWATPIGTPQTPWTSDIDGAGFTLKNAGKIGIGVANPSVKLAVDTPYTAAVTHAIFSSPYASTGDYQQILLAYDQTSVLASAGLRAIRRQTADYGAHLAFVVSSDTAPGTITERMRILANGNVGIGATAPDDKLTVVAPANVPNLSTFGGGVLVQGAQGVDLEIGASNASPFPMWIQARSHAPAAAYPLVINPLGGNVGVNKTNPSYAFDVTGDVNCTGAFRVNGTPISAGGGFTTQSVVTGSRVLNIVYQNTSGKPMLVTATVSITNATLNAVVDAASSPSTVVASPANASGTTQYVTVSFVVLPGYYYKVFQSGGSATIGYWVEWT